ncbi:CRTAC1 family protein [Seonamhaeicola maritimus]|uniref:CRTAC1 family protein n=1 Tax=Seonamhaeicola maritimus TaxID=2591822 RepID=UPI00249446B0|nr:CRTAC1 family protein [Seonamhaeicola maritimus]
MNLLKRTYKTLFLVQILQLVLLSACSNNKKEVPHRESTQFTLVENTHSNIHFTNTVKEDLNFNFINYSYIYNGGGVAVGDINNDGLEDLYFTSNQNSNKLYLNKGDFKFEDITESANVSDNGGWTTGTTMIDINNDGWLDIYVCKSGSLKSHKPRENKLFINQQNNTFKESAEVYGLNHFGFSIQAYFFDYDADDDLDMYLVNHRADFRNNTNIDAKLQTTKEPYNSDQLFRNDIGKFTNVTHEAGVENKAWGLSASIGDFNNDNLPDIYVANDFLEPDFLYINQGNGTFKDEILDRFKHISANSMGSDYADINNDLHPDLIALDMMAEDHIRSKENMATMSTENFNAIVNAGYHYQYMSNVLQLNNGNGVFSEIGQLSGIAKTDWSWAPLIADFDNDGFNDLFVTNGIEHDLSNQDFRNQMRTNIRNRKKVSLDEAINMMPSHKLSNYIFRNNSDLTFRNLTSDWGLNQKLNSTGAVYADLDNDGDLDIVLNNQSDKASVYKNNSVNNYITVSLKGPQKNKKGIGSQVIIYTDNNQQIKKQFVSRGYQSSVTYKLHFGLGNKSKIDSIVISWPNGSTQVLSEPKINKTILVDFKESENSKRHSSIPEALFVDIDPNDIGVDFIQKENQFNDYNLQLLLPQKQSENSEPLTVGDVNNDGLEDFFVGNAKDAKASLYIQKSDGTFIETNKSLFHSEKAFEDTDALFFDIDNDNDLDLYVASGGYEFEENSPFLQDRLYINNGKGKFQKSNELPENLSNTQCIAMSDYDNDGDKDVFLGSSVIHGKYPVAYPSHLLKNHNGKLLDVTSQTIDDISDLTMVNDAIFSDYDKDGDDDLIVVGEWMPITIFENSDGKFLKKEIDTLKNTNGWYQSITPLDFNNDGNEDYIIGNWGNNNKFHPSKNKPLHIYADYLDDNTSFDIVLSKVSKTGDLLPVRGKECSSQQTPFINNKLKTYNAFANATLPEIYGESKLNEAIHFKAANFSSILVKNIGNNGFSLHELPNQAQFSPTLATQVLDVNNDGYLDVFGIGNIYQAEVETVRYDASLGYILLGDKNESYSYLNDVSYFNEKEAKAIKKIIIKGEPHLIILNKNNSLKILKLKNHGKQ